MIARAVIARPVDVVAVVVVGVLVVALVDLAQVGYAQPSKTAPSKTERLAAQAQTAFAELRYDDALGLIDRAWHAGDSDPARLAQLFALAGQAAGSRGDGDAARLWFSRWLAIEPEAQLAPGTSPKLTALLADARRGIAGASITARARRADGATSGASGGALVVELVADPLAMVAAARAGDERVPLRRGVQAELSGAGEVVELLDRDGNVLKLERVDEPARRDVAADPGRASRAGDPVRSTAGGGDDRGDDLRAGSPWYARWPSWAIAAGGFALASGGALLIAVDARSQIRDLTAASWEHDFSEVQPLERRFDIAQWSARIALGGALVSVAVATVLHVRGRAVRASISPAGAAVGWSF